MIDSIGVIIKYFDPDSEPLWPVYTLFILVGWTMYAPAQLLVLYSRLHLINQNRKLQRWVLILIVAVACLTIIPTWPFAWMAYNPYDKHLTSLYSPRLATLDRCLQLAYTAVEIMISSTYVWSLLKLLNLKSSVRQRRVMTDLIYVIIMGVCLDLLSVILVFLNQLGSSHPVQTFSYALKLKLEFVVLNQLMAVAARGLKKESFAERRYHQDPDTSSSEKRSATTAVSSKTSRWGLESDPEPLEPGSVDELVVPSPTLSRAKDAPNERPEGGKWPKKAKVKKRGIKRARDGVEEDEDEEIGVHMWERRGNLVMEIPWFKVDGTA